MSVTAFGRQMIEFTKTQVEEHFNIDHGYEENAEVIYGDTDSVMVKFGTEDLSRAMELGQSTSSFCCLLLLNILYRCRGSRIR